jgi:hypothetical protein
MDPDRHLSNNPGAEEAQNGAMEGRERSQWKLVERWLQIRISFDVKQDQDRH